MKKISIKSNIGFVGTEKTSIIPALALSFASCFMLFVYAPMEIYFENKSEYWFDIRHLFPVCLMMFLAGVAASMCVMAVARIINDKLYCGMIAIYLIGYLCTYVQGNYFVSDLPVLDGSPVSWDLYDYQRKYSIILWIVVIAVIILLYKFAKKDTVIRCAEYLPLGISAVLLITLTVVCINNDGLAKKLSIAVSTDYELEMSTDKNFIIIVLDSLDGNKLTQMFDSHPEYQEAMKDFTYFDNTMAAYPYTEFAIPYIISGDWFECDEYIDDYKRKTYKTAPIFDVLEEQGYRLGLYEAEAPLTDESMYRFENVQDIHNEFTSVVDFIKVEMRLVGLRYAPYDMKQRCLVLPEEIPNLRKQVNGIELCNFDNSDRQLYDDVLQKGITYTDDKCFKFIHLEGAHVPFVYDAQLNTIENGTYEQSVEAAMYALLTYLQVLKDSGVYDNSVIFITSDHGFNWDDNSDAEIVYTPEKRQQSMLFVKGYEENHDEMVISEAPISHEDYQEAYLRLLDGADSSNVFDWKEGDYRERRYLEFYLWNRDHMDEYVQTGHAKDADSMVLTGVQYDQAY
jgi:hypothetical protein